MKLPSKVKAYIFFIMCLSVSASSVIMYLDKSELFTWSGLIFWSLLSIVTESLVLKLPSGMGISVGLAVLPASLLASGPVVAIFAAAFGFLFRVVKNSETGKIMHFLNTPAYKSFFNAAQGVLSITASGLVFYFLGGASGGVFNVILTLLMVAIYSLINSLVMANLFALMSKKSFVKVWMSNVKGLFINVLLLGIMGIILFLAYESYGYGAVVLFLGPLLLARFSFKQYNDLRGTYLETIKAFNELTEAKDAYTGEHSSRVETYAVMLAEHLKMPDKKVESIRMAAILHDIGKIGIDDEILRKPAKLTDEEYELIKNHPVIGAKIIRKVYFLKDVADIVEHHHERYDGRGYPSGLKGDQISIESSILALADVYDAITSNRSYRDPFYFERAKEEIRINAGTQFHPELALKFVEVMEQNKEVFDRNAN